MLCRDVNSDSNSANPRGPVFLSYRHSDGAELAINMAWALRSAGIPVWLDKNDLPPGDTKRRLDEAMRSGMSGAVLIVTPDIKDSSCIKDLELPRLLALEKQGTFTLSIASTIKKKNGGGLDYCAPDRLLSQPSGSLRRLRQDASVTPGDLAKIALNHCRQRMEAIKGEIELADQMIEISLQTRFSPSSTDLFGDLVMRLRPPVPDDRRPNRQGLEEWKLSLSNLPHLLQIAGARHTRFSGGAHLSVAFALGAALPTPLLGRVEAVDTDGHTWALSNNTPATAVSTRLLEITDRSLHETISGDALVYVDLKTPRSDSVFEQFLAAHPGRFAGVFHIRTAAEGNLRPADANAIVAEASYAIRQAASLSNSPEVHLFLRCPWTVALLLGRTLNTIRVHVHEWEDGPGDDGSDVGPRYLPSLLVRSGAGGGPIERVVLPARPEASA